MYGGAYAYGKTEHAVRYEGGESRKATRRKPREQWLAMIRDTHEGYVSWEQFEQIQQVIASNDRGWDQSGAVQNGPALLAGLLRCRRCGRKLTVRYSGNKHNVMRYACHRGFLDNGQARCIALGGRSVDEAIAQEVLRVVQPAAVDAAVLASEQEARKQDDVLQALRRDLQAARYSAGRPQKSIRCGGPGKPAGGGRA